MLCVHAHARMQIPAVKKMILDDMVATGKAAKLRGFEVRPFSHSAFAPVCVCQRFMSSYASRAIHRSGVRACGRASGCDSVRVCYVLCVSVCMRA